MRILPTVASVLIVSCPQAARHSVAQDEPLIALRLARVEAGLGFTPMKLRGADTIFHVEDRRIVSDDDIKMARAIRQPGALVVSIWMRSDAAARLRQVTGEHVGERLGIFWSGQFVSAPLIVSRLDVSDGHVDIGFSLPDSVSERMNQAVQEKWGSPPNGAVQRDTFLRLRW